MKWRAISTAPRDGTDIVLWWKHCDTPSIGRWVITDDSQGWLSDGDLCLPKNQWDCTHWLPLPKPPTATGHLKGVQK